MWKAVKLSVKLYQPFLSWNFPRLFGNSYSDSCSFNTSEKQQVGESCCKFIWILLSKSIHVWLVPHFTQTLLPEFMTRTCNQCNFSVWNVLMRNLFMESTLANANYFIMSIPLDLPINTVNWTCCFRYSWCFGVSWALAEQSQSVNSTLIFFQMHVFLLIVGFWKIVFFFSAHI